MTSVDFRDGHARIALLWAVDQDIHLGAPRSYHRTSGSRGGVRHYVGGIRRAVIIPGRTNVVRISFPRPSWQHLATLESWVGSVILYRDSGHHLFIGLLKSVDETQDPNTPYEMRQAGVMNITIETTTDTPETLL